MRVYFNSTDNTGGMVCEEQLGMDDTFNKMKRIHQKSFQDLGGEYVERDGKEKTCAIRLAPTVFFEVIPRFGLAGQVI